MLELEHIQKSFDGVPVLKDISLQVADGEIVSILGPSGCGKSTLLRMVAGLERVDSGVIRMDGKSIHRVPPRDRDIAMVFQNYALYPHMTVYGNMAYALKIRKVPKKEIDKRVHEVARILEIEHLLDRRPGELSGGQRKRLALVAALLVPCDVLILDEPTNDLDTQTLAILEDYLDSYEGIVIVVSHDRYFLDRVVRRIFAFEGNGEIRQYEGGYTDYVNRLAEEGRKPGGTVEVQEAAVCSALAAEGAQDGGVTGTSGQDAAEQADSRNTWKREKKLKFSYKEQREYETIEDDIANLEAKVEQLDADMAENATNSVKLGELLAEKEAAEQALEEKMERWEYLEELAAKIAEQE